MKKFAKIVGGLLVVVAIVAVGVFAWAKSAAGSRMNNRFETHNVDFPVPFPLSAAEIEEIRVERSKTQPDDPLAGVDLNAIALERAVSRGKHLIESRYVCSECHGADFAGGTMVDDGALGHVFGVNLTSGKGGVVSQYKVADWDRIVRHGVKPDGTPAAMPSIDFFGMADRELSDIIAVVQSAKPVDKEVPRPVWGPVGTILLGLNKMPLSAEERANHQEAHLAEAPPSSETIAFGKHVAQVCTGCHTTSFAGGKISAGPPDWPPARNLTPHADGLAGWTYEDFVRALREGKRKNGEMLKPPMSWLTKSANKVTDTEMKALWAFLQQLPPVPTP